MGVAVSNWSLAQAVSKLGQLGTVSGTALNLVVARRLQCGDPGGHIRRALNSFAFPKMAQRILDNYFIPGGKKLGTPFKAIAKPLLKGSRAFNELCIVSNFVEVFLAREGHKNAVAINYLEKIQLPHLPSLYGAILAGASFVVVGAGIATEMPAAIEALTNHRPATYPIRVNGSPTAIDFEFNPADYLEDGVDLPTLTKPSFLPIVSSDSLATMFMRRAKGQVDGFIVEAPTAGGHNAPPRGALQLDANGEPLYGPKDIANLEKIRALGLPFWLGGGYASPAKLAAALAAGATGIQAGTPFALCTDSGLLPELRQALMQQALNGTGRVVTDHLASPTGFPFKVAQLPGSLSEEAAWMQRIRVCDLGYLREAYLCADGTVGFRCPAETAEAYAAKGGDPAETTGRKCVCNGLMAAIGLTDPRPWGAEPPLLTLGDAYAEVTQFCTNNSPDFSAADVINTLLA
jgi:nitronate monooxygenase